MTSQIGVPSDRLMRIGAWIVVAGLVLTVIAIAPLFIPSLTMASGWWFASMLTVMAGIVVLIVGFARTGRARRRITSR